MKAARNWLAASSAPLAGNAETGDGIGSGRCASSGDASDRGASFVSREILLISSKSYCVI
jgi:hypothetical protein